MDPSGHARFRRQEIPLLARCALSAIPGYLIYRVIPLLRAYPYGRLLQHGRTERASHLLFLLIILMALALLALCFAWWDFALRAINRHRKPPSPSATTDAKS